MALDVVGEDVCESCLKVDGYKSNFRKPTIQPKQAKPISKAKKNMVLTSSSTTSSWAIEPAGSHEQIGCWEMQNMQEHAGFNTQQPRLLLSCDVF